MGRPTASRPWRALLVAATVALAACTAEAPDPIQSLAPSDRSGPIAGPPLGPTVRFDKGELSDDSTILTLRFVGGREFAVDDRCSTAYAGWAAQVGETLEAEVIDVTPRAPAVEGQGCDLVGHSRSVSVRLESPFLGSRLHDRGGDMHFVRRPAGLIELRALPGAWVLRSEGDVQESPTGRWEQTYSPRANPNPGTSKGKLDLYQAFGGPAGVSGGEEIRTVKVNGRDATLYRFAPDGELVLVWQLGADGLALVANEAEFPVRQLIALAESARAPFSVGATCSP